MPFSRKILAIDASTELCSVCWTDGARSIERRLDAGQRHSALMLALVEAVLQEAGCRPADLDEVAFGAGPGSFTGLRIACGIAQGLAFGAGLPVRAVSSLLALAEAATQPVGEAATVQARAPASVIAALDARMNEVYWAAYRRGSDGRWTEIVRPSVSAAGAIVLPALDESDNWVGAGNAFARFAALSAAMPSRSRIDPAIEVTARAIASLALTGHGELDLPERAMPAYIRDKVAMTTAERAARR